MGTIQLNEVTVDEILMQVQVLFFVLRKGFEFDVPLRGGYKVHGTSIDLG